MAADLPLPNAEEQARHRTLFASFLEQPVSSHYFGIGSTPTEKMLQCQVCTFSLLNTTFLGAAPARSCFLVCPVLAHLYIYASRLYLLSFVG